MLNSIFKPKLVLPIARLCLTEGIIEEGKTELPIAGTRDMPSSMVNRKEKSFFLFMTSIYQKGKHFALWSGLNYGIMGDPCHSVVGSFWERGMYPVEFRSRCDHRVGDCFSSGHLCRKEKYMKAKRWGKERVWPLARCLSFLFGGRKMTEFLKSQSCGEFSWFVEYNCRGGFVIADYEHQKL